MIKYKKKFSFLILHETWFDHNYTIKDVFSLYGIFHLKQDKKVWGIKEISHTIELNLEQETAAIFSGFSKVIRQDIKKAEAEEIVIEADMDKQLFVEFFNDFAKKKGTFCTTKERILEKGSFLECWSANNNGNILAAHSYLVDAELKIVRHYQTATKRFDQDLDKNLVGRASKYLLVKSILIYKERGFKIFDFGGYAKDTIDESLMGINNYKLKFGGEVVPCRDYYSYIYWFLKKLSKMIGYSSTV